MGGTTYDSQVQNILEIIEQDIDFNIITHTEKEVLQTIKRHLEFLNGKGEGYLSKRTIENIDIAELSGIQGTIAMLLFSLGDIMNNAKYDYAIAKKKVKDKEYKYIEAVEKQFIDAKKKFTQKKVAGAVSHLMLRDDLKETVLERRANTLHTLYFNLKELLEVMKLRIYVLMSLKSQGKFLDNSVMLPPEIQINT